ncbi:recombinase RecA [Thermodesulfobacterium commune]|uniref:Protein RecA n=2 Tax=Thermodesulfobacterium commune TaxID=1741 RepID=A0A075X093_9BACT|nr:recombinase RecA [Thermodesulfobacterium commune]AIH04412.1 recombinase RecA [Thermodesulfobacterium commune DSM 2178]HAA83553.1 recombinase RecA [Thermodesulfobacterium commune]HBT03527.1 recombinase RecA [Thermodesulfobacterium commune]HCE79590.1 recombinase RecA [Thermodesulfobacterium commune]HCP09736.1 recombinase RecA [Thermodesulfobacterium commune]
MDVLEKKKAVEAAISQIEKMFGKGSIMRLGEGAKKIEVSVIPTGSLSLDIATGIGGIPRGRITEIYGAEASGKTTLALHMVAEAQKQGGVAAFIDAEHALDLNYAQKLGVNIEDLLVSQPDTGEQALEIAEVLARSGAVDIIVIDSVAALVPKAEIEGEMEDQQVGLQARLMSKAMRKLTSAISKSNTAVVFINQTRMKIGTFSYGGPPETTPGGMALKFFASLRLEIKKIASIKEGQEPLGHRVKVKVVKNKLAPPFKEVEFDIYFGEGISKEAELVDLGVEMEVIEKSGSWFSYQGERLGQGKENVRKLLKENKQLALEIENKIREKAGLPLIKTPSEKSTEKPQKGKQG